MRAPWTGWASRWPAWLLIGCALLLTGCRGGAAGRAAALPQPTNLGQWLAIAVFVIGIWWVVMKITGR